MDAEKLELLQLKDNETACEFPPDFNYRASMKRVEDLKLTLDTIVGRSFELNRNVQDASFFTELYILEPPDSLNIYHYVLAVRFSSFGNLFTVWSNSIDEKIGDEKTAQVIAEVEAMGFVYVDAETLEQKYTGKNLHLIDKVENWWSRFFDYL